MLIEASVSVFMLMLTLGVNLELIRRVHIEVILHHAAFWSVRDLLFGANPTSRQARIKRLLRSGFSFEKANQVFQNLEVRHRCEPEARTDIYYRFPSLFRFFEGENRMKHHFEVTKSCPFRS